jgi:hypothetical protein
MSDVDDDIERQYEERRAELKRTGGPAFPAEGGSDSGLYAAPGMTLRDYFAATVLAGIGTWTPVEPYFTPDLKSKEALKARAEWAYRQADSMLKAREA